LSPSMDKVIPTGICVFSRWEIAAAIVILNHSSIANSLETGHGRQ
jgi:hypothetical protein